MNKGTQDKFKFYFPADLIKSTNTKGEEVMRVKGIASTSDKDAQGEYLDPSGFDLTGFRWLNWNHLGKSDPASIIGEPDLAKCKITPDNKMYIEGHLYPELDMAKATFKLMKALNNSPMGNKLSLSVEGKVLERDKINPKKVLKSRITAVAICPVPVNGNTWTDVITKGVTGYESEDMEYDETTQDLLKADTATQVLSRSDIYDRIFGKFPGIELEKAKQVYKLIEKTATIMEKGTKSVSEDTIKKSFEILGLASAEIEKSEKDKEKEKEVEKAEKEEKERVEKAEKEKKEKEKKEKEKEEPEEEEDEEMYEKAVHHAKEMKKGGKGKEDVKKALIKKGYNDGIAEKAIKKADDAEDDKEGEREAAKKNAKEIGKSFAALEDLIKAQSDDFGKKFNAMGVLQKSIMEENEELRKSLETTLEANAKIKEDVEKLATTPLNRKSISTKSYSEKFEKSAEGEKVFNINSKVDRAALKNHLMDISGIEKGESYDKPLVNIAQTLEVTKGLQSKDVAALRAIGIRVVQE